MGTTLTNGIYLPNEGEKNCYAGLKTNWETLDQKIADITALQQAVAGALHREIVESLPTTDINPNTIYMVLSGTSATENVYNEFMYVNNAWELIGTSATDLTNYYTKGEVDGLLVLKANASDLTSHTGDTTIHVTASDKTKWTNSANTHVLRLALSALTPSTSDNSFSNLDDSTALKVGDKVMDTAGVLFEVTAIDTQNSTFTIGTALVDLAQDSDVVHKSGDENIAGYKVFENICLSNSIKAINLENKTIDLNNCYSSFGLPQSGNISFYFCNTNNGTVNISNLPEQSAFFLISQSIRILSGGSVVYAKQTLVNSNGKTFVRYCNNSVWDSWQNVTNLVTTDTAQTITGAKTFDSNTLIYNSDNTATTPNLYLRSSKIEISSQGNTSGDQNLTYLDKNNATYAYVKGAIQSNGSAVKIRSVAKDSSDNSVINELQILAYTNGNKAIFPSYSNEVDLGISSYKWKSISATNYYYGNDNVEFSDKFVTTDTAQTISGNKSFSDNISTKKIISNVAQLQINARSSADSVAVIAGADASEGSGIWLYGKSSVNGSDCRMQIYNTTKSRYERVDLVGSQFLPSPSGELDCGSDSYKWKTFNGVEPSSLSLPSGNVNDVIDISSYLTYLDGTLNTYTAPANGWITINMNNCSGIQAYINGLWGHQIVRPNAGGVRFLMPILKNQTANILIFGGSIDKARFIPCQGNV